MLFLNAKKNGSDQCYPFLCFFFERKGGIFVLFLLDKCCNTAYSFIGELLYLACTVAENKQVWLEKQLLRPDILSGSLC